MESSLHNPKEESEAGPAQADAAEPGFDPNGWAPARSVTDLAEVSGERHGLEILRKMAELAQISGQAFQSFNGSAKSAAQPPNSNHKEPHRWEADLRYRALVENIPAVTFMAALDENVHELYVSPQIESLLGYSQQEWLENPFLWFNQLHPDDRERWRDAFAQTCATGASFRSEYRLLARDHRVVWVHGECQVIRGEKGQPLFLQGIAFDITEIKRAEEALQRIHQELEKKVLERTAELAEANDALRAQIAERKRAEEQLRLHAAELAETSRRKDAFLAMLAHELRNPLAAIRTASDYLQIHNPEGTERTGSQDVIGRQVRHLGRLVDDLLDVSRITHGKIGLRKEPVCLAKLVSAAVEAVRPMIEARRHKLITRITGEDLLFLADFVRLQQVLANLLNNAAKYTEPGGMIWLAAEQEGDQLELRVRDTGMGIEPAMLPRIFETFVQADNSVARSQGGLGIGLTLVRQLVELHGGTVEAVSAGLGCGSEFIVRLPVIHDELALSAVSNSPPPAVAKGLNILIVDDNQDAARGLAKLLALAGHNLHVALDGPSGVAIAQLSCPDVVLLDIGLPGMDGYTVAAELRRHPTTADVRIFALTGYSQEDDRQRARTVGIDRYLTKPVDLAELNKVLREFYPAGPANARVNH